jgi:hypothetical protein
MISLFLVFLAGICNACMDVLRFHYATSIFSKWRNQQWVNPTLSWTNKWKPSSKLGDLLMSTVFVWVTDFWHLCKHIMLILLFLSVVLYQPLFNWWIDFFLFFGVFTITFELFFSKVFKIKNK